MVRYEEFDFNNHQVQVGLINTKINEIMKILEEYRQDECNFHDYSPNIDEIYRDKIHFSTTDRYGDKDVFWFPGNYLFADEDYIRENETALKAQRLETGWLTAQRYKENLRENKRQTIKQLQKELGEE